MAWHGIQLFVDDRLDDRLDDRSGGGKENDDVQDGVCGSKDKCQVGHAKGNREKTRKPKPKSKEKIIKKNKKKPPRRVKATA